MAQSSIASSRRKVTRQARGSRFQSLGRMRNVSIWGKWPDVGNWGYGHLTRTHGFNVDPVHNVIVQSFCMNKKVPTQGAGIDQHPNLAGVRKICLGGERLGQKRNEFHV